MNYKKELKHIGITFKKVSDIIGISNVMLSYYLNGVRDMPNEIEIKLKSIIEKYK